MFSTFASSTIFHQGVPFVASFLIASSLPLCLFKTISSLSFFLSPRSWVLQIPGQVGGLTALNILHNIFVFSKALMQALPQLLLQWIFHIVCQWFLWLAPLNFWPWIPSIFHNFESMQVSWLKKLFLAVFLCSLMHLFPWYFLFSKEYYLKSWNEENLSTHANRIFCLCISK